MKISHGCLLLHCMLTTLPMEWTGHRVIDRRADGGAGTLAAPPSQRAAIPASHPPRGLCAFGGPGPLLGGGGSEELGHDRKGMQSEGVHEAYYSPDEENHVRWRRHKNRSTQA